MMEFEDELTLDFDPLDATRIWPEEVYPFMPVGKMVLDKNPVNYFAEIEQAAFSPVSLVPGIEPSADKILQGRLFSYADTQRHRLGPNYFRIPVNRVRSPVNTPHSDGAMRSEDQCGMVGEPGSPADLHTSAGSPSEGRVLTGGNPRRKFPPPDNFRQAGERYRSLSPVEREHLVDNIVDSLRFATGEIQMRMVENFSQADGEFGELVRKGLHL